MKWFWKWVDKKIDRSRDYVMDCEAVVSSPMSGLSSDCFRFNLYNGNGGFVVEVAQSGRGANAHYGKSDPAIGLYIIREDQDLGRELSKIVTLETCRR